MTPAKMTEAKFFAEVLALCEGRDLWPVVIKPERRNQRMAANKGFPDLMIIGPSGILFRELKTDIAMSIGGGLRPNQTVWRYRFQATGLDWAVWQPRDLASGLIDDQLDDLEQPDKDTDTWALTMAR